MAPGRNNMLFLGMERKYFSSIYFISQTHNSKKKNKFYVKWQKEEEKEKDIFMKSKNRL